MKLGIRGKLFLVSLGLILESSSGRGTTFMFTLPNAARGNLPVEIAF